MMLPESCLPIVMFVPGSELTRDRQLFLAVSNHHDIRQPAQANCDTLVKTHCQLKIRTFFEEQILEVMKKFVLSYTILSLPTE